MSDSTTASRNLEPTECHLRILSGPHLGVCVPLSQGDYLIGSGLDCDFVIADGEISPCHATLAVTRGNAGLRVENSDSATFIEGKRISGTSISLHPDQVFTLGRTHFALTEKADAASVGGILLPELEPPSGDSSTDEPESESSEEISAGNPIADSVGAIDFEESEPAPKLGSGVFLGLMSIVILGLAMWLLFANPFDPPEPVETEEKSVEPAVAVAKLLEKFPEEKGVILELDDSTGILTLNGIVSGSDTKLQLTREIREIAPRTRIKVSSLPTTEAAVRSVLDQMGGESLAVELALDGTVTLSGQLSDDIDLATLSQRLVSDFTAVSKINSDAVWTRSTLVEKLSAETEASGLEEFLTFALEDTDLVIGGTLPPDKEQSFVLLRNGLVAEFEPVLTIVDRVKILKSVPVSTRSTIAGSPRGGEISEPGPKPVSGPLEVPLSEKVGIAGFRNVTVGAINWVVTSEGQKLLEGATLASGFTVEKITRDYVQLRKQNIIETIYLK